MCKRLVVCVGFFVFALASFSASAQTEVLDNATVSRLLSKEGMFGECMAKINKVPVIANCPNTGWVSFSCDGTYNSVQVGKMSYGLALLAYSLGKKLYIEIDDTKLHDGYCFASRVDLRN